MGRIVWAQLRVDDRRTLNCGVPFRIQPFHRLKLELPQGTEGLGVQLQLYTFTRSEMECCFPHSLQGDLKGAYTKAAEQCEFSRACCGQDKEEWL